MKSQYLKMSILPINLKIVWQIILLTKFEGNLTKIIIRLMDENGQYNFEKPE